MALGFITLINADSRRVADGISVALCTFNGEPFLDAQLASLTHQTRLPDEVVICDDGSTDETPALLRAFKASAAFPVQVHLNRENLGSTKNFEKAISLCNFGIIALCDQDDLWHETKLMCIENAMEYQEVEGVFSDAEIVDENLQTIGRSLWDWVGFSAKDRRRFFQGTDFELLLRRNVVTGATFAFRASVRARALPIPSPWVHDAWLALIIAAAHRLRFMDCRLVSYRQHSGNQIGAISRWQHLVDAWDQLRLRDSRERFAVQRDLFVMLEERLVELGLEASVEMALLREKIRHLSVRTSLPAHRLARFSSVRNEVAAGGYARFSRGWLSAAKDLL